MQYHIVYHGAISHRLLPQGHFRQHGSATREHGGKMAAQRHSAAAEGTLPALPPNHALHGEIELEKFLEDLNFTSIYIYMSDSE